MGKLSTYARSALVGHILNSGYTAPAAVYLTFSKAFNIRNASYQWTASGSGTDEYYLEASGGGNPSLGGNPETVIANNLVLAAGTPGSLSASNWGYGDNDTLGFSTIYVRLADGADPDSKADGFVLAGGNPFEDASGLVEPSGNSFARTQITFGGAAARRVTQNAQVNFPEASGEWGWVTHWAVMDADSAGNLLAFGSLVEAKHVVSGNTPSIASSEIYIQLNAGKVSTVVANKLLDLMFRNQAYSAPDTYAGLATSTLDDSTTGSTVAEPSGNNYARVQVNPNGGASPTWNTTGATVDNADAVDLPTPSAPWGTAVAAFIASADSGGDILFYDNDLVDQAVGTGDTLTFPVGSIVVGIN